MLRNSALVSSSIQPTSQRGTLLIAFIIQFPLKTDSLLDSGLMLLHLGCQLTAETVRSISIDVIP